MEPYEVPGDFKIPRVSMIDAPVPGESAARKATSVPTPTGWKILCAVPDAKETFDGTGIIKAQEVVRAEELTSHILFVLKVGPDAYADKAKFPSGPWCKVGDFVLVRAYAGTRFKVFGKEFRLLNDDQIDGTVEDPRGIARAG
jgi:co-chaperonin GroES (HSP10)